VCCLALLAITFVASCGGGGSPDAAPADLGIIDWDQPARFRRLCEHFGPWGLALLEAIVIRADHAVSAGAGEAGA